MSAAIALAAVCVAAAVWFNEEAFIFAAAQTGLGGTGAGARLFLSFVLGAGGCMVAYYLLEIQQWLANSHAQRTLRSLTHEFEVIEDASGTEAAAKYVAPRMIKLLNDKRVDLFGGPTGATLDQIKYLAKRIRIGLSDEK